MTHDHNHSCSCDHSEVKYCSHCQVVYCKGCNQEWKTYPTYTYTWTYPYYGYQGGNGLNQYYNQALSQNVANALMSGLSSPAITQSGGGSTCSHT